MEMRVRFVQNIDIYRETGRRSCRGFPAGQHVVQVLILQYLGIDIRVRIKINISRKPSITPHIITSYRAIDPGLHPMSKQDVLNAIMPNFRDRQMPLKVGTVERLTKHQRC